MSKKKRYTIKDIAKAWANFKPKVPMEYYLATVKALKKKYGKK